MNTILWTAPAVPPVESKWARLRNGGITESPFMVKQVGDVVFWLAVYQKKGRGWRLTGHLHLDCDDWPFSYQSVKTPWDIIEILDQPSL